MFCLVCYISSVTRVAGNSTFTPSIIILIISYKHSIRGCDIEIGVFIHTHVSYYFQRVYIDSAFLVLESGSLKTYDNKYLKIMKVFYMKEVRYINTLPLTVGLA